MPHLSLAARAEIELRLRKGDNFNDIAQHLHVARTTVMREVLKHMTTSEKGTKGRLTNRCIHRSTCDRHFLLCGSCTVEGERRTNIFYCRPLSAWQKPNVENNHNNLRAIFPKGVSMDHVTQEKVELAMSHLNSKLRDGLDNIQAIRLFTTI